MKHTWDWRHVFTTADRRAAMNENAVWYAWLGREMDRFSKWMAELHQEWFWSCDPLEETMITFGKGVPPYWMQTVGTLTISAEVAA